MTDVAEFLARWTLLPEQNSHPSEVEEANLGSNVEDNNARNATLSQELHLDFHMEDDSTYDPMLLPGVCLDPNMVAYYVNYPKPPPESHLASNVGHFFATRHILPLELPQRPDSEFLNAISDMVGDDTSLDIIAEMLEEENSFGFSNDEGVQDDPPFGTGPSEQADPANPGERPPGMHRDNQDATPSTDPVRGHSAPSAHAAQPVVQVPTRPRGPTGVQGTTRAHEIIMTSVPEVEDTDISVKEEDVLCGPGFRNLYHKGTQVFRGKVRELQPVYRRAKDVNKRDIIKQLVDFVVERQSRFVINSKKKGLRVLSLRVGKDAKWIYDKCSKVLREDQDKETMSQKNKCHRAKVKSKKELHE